MLALLFVAVTVLLLTYSWLTQRPKNYPPGPPCWPLIGCAPSMTKTNLHLRMESWREKYGPLVGLILGPERAIAVVEAKAVFEVLKHEDFQGRPHGTQIRERTFGENLGVFFSDGPYWVEQRRFTLRHLKEFGFGKRSMEGVILEEAEEMMKEVKTLQDAPIQVSMLFGVSIINVLWSVMSGARYDRNDADFKKFLELLNYEFRSGDVSGKNLAAIIPPLRFLSAKWRETQKNTAAVQEFMRKSIREHEKNIDYSNPRDFIDVYLTEMQSGKSSTFHEKSLISICSDLFGAGAESVSSTLGFCLLYLVRNPAVQQAIHKELDEVVGQSRRPSLDDRARLTYVEAFLLEVMRVNTIAPLAAPHRVVRDTTFRGYDIPKNTMVFVSLWSCAQDEAHWGDPTVFRPERFLDADGHLIKDEYLVNFGLGKRVCLGEALARNTLYLFFTTMMQQFSFTLPEGAALPSTIPLSGFTTAPAPFEVIATDRC